MKFPLVSRAAPEDWHFECLGSLTSGTGAGLRIGFASLAIQHRQTSVLQVVWLAK